MIYLTVGTFPGGFDRLVRAIDTLCGKHNLECKAQIGANSYKPDHMTFSEFYTYEEHCKNIAYSDFVITHGGFGVIGDIMRIGKPFLVVPRTSSEGPNDQRDMAVRLASIYKLNLCMDIDNIERPFIDLLNAQCHRDKYDISSNIPQLVAEFLNTH